MKTITLILLTLTLAFASCEHPKTIDRYYIVEWMEEETGDIIKDVYYNRHEAMNFSHQLNDERIWNKVVIKSEARVEEEGI